METQVNKSDVRIHIDQCPCESPNPTTGVALYALGGVEADQMLYRDVRGEEDDDPIENDQEVIELRDGDKFSTGPRNSYTIIVNGQKKVVKKKRLTFAEIVTLAFPIPQGGQDILYTVTYEDGPPPNQQGSLLEGGVVKIKNGMIFNVTATNRS